MPPLAVCTMPCELKIEVRANFGEPKILILRNEDFSFVPQAQHHLTEGQHHFERSENIISHLFGTNERGCSSRRQIDKPSFL
jgi:hypothetical protein